jgi:hypothetical protein
LEVFSEATLHSLHLSLVNKFNSRFEEIDTTEKANALTEVSKIIAAVETKEIDRGEAVLRFLMLARGKVCCINKAIYNL